MHYETIFEGMCDLYHTGAMKSPSRVVMLETSDSYIPECAVGFPQLPPCRELGVSDVLRWKMQAWYSAGVLVILLRFVTRVRTVGLVGFRGDDYLSLLVRYHGVHPITRGSRSLPAGSAVPGALHDVPRHCGVHLSFRVGVGGQRGQH